MTFADPTQAQAIAFLATIIILILWETTWKLIGLWKSARNDQIGWFMVIGLINSLGIIPLVYIGFFQRKPIRRIRR